MTLLAAVCVVAVFNLFFQMDGTSALPLVYLLVLAGTDTDAGRPEARHG
jgi:hypothetical protein